MVGKAFGTDRIRYEPGATISSRCQAVASRSATCSSRFEQNTDWMPAAFTRARVSGEFRSPAMSTPRSGFRSR